ncbi:MAG TPA: hypothetical protein VEB21_08810 [Terriglobales bacterium]|nr:hypothetical protein [Terriglobales bacterium]
MRSLGGFHVRGDSQAILNVPFRRQLGFAGGALFLCGLGIAVGHWRQRRSALLLVFLFVMQVPSILALANPIEVPAALRASGCLIPACLLIGLPLPLLWRALAAQPGSALARCGRAAVMLLAAVLLVGEAGESWQRYFVVAPSAVPSKPTERAEAQGPPRGDVLGAAPSRFRSAGVAVTRTTKANGKQRRRLKVLGGTVDAAEGLLRAGGEALQVTFRKHAPSWLLRMCDVLDESELAELRKIVSDQAASGCVKGPTMRQPLEAVTSTREVEWVSSQD